MSTKPDNWDAVQKALSERRASGATKDLPLGFSGQVLARIQQPPAPPTWWQRVGLELEWKPFLACVGGACVLALLTYVVIVALHEPRPDNFTSLPSNDFDSEIIIGEVTIGLSLILVVGIFKEPTPNVFAGFNFASNEKVI